MARSPHPPIKISLTRIPRPMRSLEGPAIKLTPISILDRERATDSEGHMRVLRIAIVAAALDIFLSSCSALLCGPDIAHAPAADYFGPAVRDSEAAIIIARAVWLSKHPELENES